MPSRPSAERHSRIMPLAVLCLLGGISRMIGGVADGYEHGFGALRDLHGGNRWVIGRKVCPILASNPCSEPEYQRFKYHGGF